MIRVQLVGRPGAVLETVRARLSSTPIEVVGVSATMNHALGADADVVVALDDAPIDAVIEDGGPGLIVIGDEEAVGRLAHRAEAAWGVVPVDASGAELRAAIGAVAEGLVVVPPSAARGLARTIDGDVDVDQEPLTAREREVLEFASHGLSNRDVAAALGISEHTVKFHLASIYGKLGAGSRTEAVRRGLRRGLITL